MTRTTRLILAAACAAALAGGTALATDELAKGEWEGRRTFQASTSGPGTGGGGTLDAVEGDGSTGGGTATEPDDPAEEGSGTTSGEDDEPAQNPEEPTPDPLGPRELDPATGSCKASWTYGEVTDTPRLVHRDTTLTLVLFRTDAFGFVCNGFARAISTWYVDWVATSGASHNDEARYEATVTLVGRCPGCMPTITVLGLSSLEAKAQLRTSWGTLAASSSASALAHSAWAGPVDCGDACSATVANQKGSSTYGVDFGPVKASNTDGTSFASAVGLGGRGQMVTIPGITVTQVVQNSGAVAVYAAGSEDNAQAKTRTGYELSIKGNTSCGAACELAVKKITK